jgi:hypothetical protein
VAPQDGSVEEIAARLASRAHGVVTRRALLAAGITSDQIRWRQAIGSLIRVHRGVYRVGHRAPSREATYLAAVLACGDGAVLRGAAAGHLFGLVVKPPSFPAVSAPVKRRITGIRCIRHRRLDPGEVTRWRGIPVATVALTLVDLAAELDEPELGRALHEAQSRHRVGNPDVEAMLARHRNARGSRRLRRLLHGETPLALSRLEERFIAVVRAARLPVPLTNVVTDGRLVDCRWPDQGLTVELDSYRFHNSRQSWERDRQREREARRRGDAFRRYTWADVAEEPAAMLVELECLLSRPKGSPGGRRARRRVRPRGGGGPSRGSA